MIDDNSKTKILTFLDQEIHDTRESVENLEETIKRYLTNGELRLLEDCLKPLAINRAVFDQTLYIRDVIEEFIKKEKA